ncbi:MAG: hypothetical protein AAFV25_27150, partial [Bacteroidota bacterium]
DFDLHFSYFVSQFLNQPSKKCLFSPSRNMIPSNILVVYVFGLFLVTSTGATCIVESLTLWNADAAEPIDTLDNLDGVISLCRYRRFELNLEVSVGCPVETVAMTLTDTDTGDEVVSQTEGVSPYMLGGDINEPFSVNALPALKTPGNYELTVDPKPGPVQTFSFVVEACPEIESLVLWEADIDDSKPIDTLENLGGVIDLCEYEGIDLNLEVVMTAPVQSVTMILTDADTDVEILVTSESASPFMLGGDINVPFSANPLPALKVPGNYKLRVNPKPGPPETFTFAVKACEKSNDVVFLLDLSGSFGADIADFQANAAGIIEVVREKYPNTRFGVGSFIDYPVSPHGIPSDFAYNLDIDLTSDDAALLSAIAALTTNDGYDLPESQLTAIYEVITGEGDAFVPAGQQASFDPCANKLIVLWTDAPMHTPTRSVGYPGRSFDDVEAAIQSMGDDCPAGGEHPLLFAGLDRASNADTLADLATVAAFSGAFVPAGGMDCDGDGIAEVAEGEEIVCPDVTGDNATPGICAVIVAGLDQMAS